MFFCSGFIRSDMQCIMNVIPNNIIECYTKQLSILDVFHKKQGITPENKWNELQSSINTMIPNNDYIWNIWKLIVIIILFYYLMSNNYIHYKHRKYTSMSHAPTSDPTSGPTKWKYRNIETLMSIVCIGTVNWICTK